MFPHMRAYFQEPFGWFSGFETWPLITKTGMPKVRFSLFICLTVFSQAIL